MSFLAHVLVLTTFAAMAFAADDSSLSSATLPICSPVGPVWRFCTNVSSTEFLGNITSTNADVIRDLGFHGTVGKYHINSYGDTFGCSVKNSTHQINCTIPIGGNTAAFSTDDPVQVTDWNLHEDTLWNNLTDLPFQFCDYDATENPRYDWGMGITNVVETGTDKGILFFARNYHPFSPQSQWVTTPGITGSGVAIIDTSGSYPTCTRTATQWWGNTEPIFGDHGAVDGKDGYIYAFGQPLQTALELYLTRVPKGQAATLSAYEYWHGPAKGFTKDRLYNRTQDMVALRGTNQGSILWSPYLNGWISVSRDPCKFEPCFTVHGKEAQLTGHRGFGWNHDQHSRILVGTLEQPDQNVPSAQNHPRPLRVCSHRASTIRPLGQVIVHLVHTKRKHSASFQSCMLFPLL